MKKNNFTKNKNSSVLNDMNTPLLPLKRQQNVASTQQHSRFPTNFTVVNEPPSLFQKKQKQTQKQNKNTNNFNTTSNYRKFSNRNEILFNDNYSKQHKNLNDTSTDNLISNNFNNNFSNFVHQTSNNTNKINKNNAFLNRNQNKNKSKLKNKNCEPPTQNIIQYNEQFIYNLQNTPYVKNNKLPESVLKILFTNCTIRQEMSKNDVAEYKKEIEDLTEEQIKKTIRGLCNKIGDKTYMKIHEKLKNLINLHLKKYSELLLFTLDLIITTSINLLVVIGNSNIKNKFLQLKHYAIVCKLLITNEKEKQQICDIITNKLEIIYIEFKKQKENKINHLENNIELYIKEKNTFINLFIFIISLYNIEVLDIQFIIPLLEKLYNEILNSTKDQNSIFISAFYTIFFNMKDAKKITNYSISKLKYLQKHSEFTNKSKFELMDIIDTLYKK